jgi:hypothetical protein
LSGRALTESERASLNLILEGLRYLFEKEVILQEEIDDALQNLKSEGVKSYVSSLRYGSKPESAYMSRLYFSPHPRPCRVDVS